MRYKPSVMWQRAAVIRDAVDRFATPGRILLAGWVLFVIYAYPGYMTYDSVWQLEQARGIEPINEWHPPLMTVLWRFIDRIIAGPFPMLVLQSTAFLLGVAAVLRQVMSPRAAAIVAALVLLAPPNLVVLAVIWKDCQMAGLVFASLAALLSPRRWVRVAGYVLLSLATGIRYNAAGATLPIVLGLFAWRTAMPRWRRWLLAGALWLAITAAALVVSTLVVEKRVHPWATAAAPVDLVGIIHFSDLTDDELARMTPGVPWTRTDDLVGRVTRHYDPGSTYLDIVQGDSRLMAYPDTDEQFDAIAAAWKALVLAEPIAFVRHRLAVFRVELELPTGGPGGFSTSFINATWAQDALRHRAAHSRVQRLWIQALVASYPVYGLSVGAYFALAIALLPLCRRQRIAAVLVASGILYQLGLLMVAPAIDYRYSHWMVVSTLVTAIVLFATRLRRARAPAALVSGEDLR